MIRKLKAMWYHLLGRVSDDDIRAHPPSMEIREATHALNTAAAKLQGAVLELKRENETAFAEFERRMQHRRRESRS